MVFNRTNYKSAVRRPEFDKTGIYVLVGSSEDSSLPMVYVGEGDPVKDRLNQHYSKKDFWEWAVFFVSKDNSLNKAHVKHLESRLLELAKAAKQCKLDNSQTPLKPLLSEAETADVESFLLDIMSIFPLLGLGVFEKTVTANKPTSLNQLSIGAKGIQANAYEDAKGFVVRKGSQVVKDEVPSIDPYTKILRNDLPEQGVIAENGKHYVFTQDQVFNSPSTAAAVVLGRAANGRIEWKTKDGRTLKQIQEAVTETTDDQN